jgi:hypothetical protein
MIDRDTWLREYGEELLLADGLDAAIIGVVERCGQQPFVVYDAEHCIELLAAQGMDEDEAAEFFAFNVAGAWVGPHTPGFLIRPPEEEEERPRTSAGPAVDPRQQDLFLD